MEAWRSITGEGYGDVRTNWSRRCDRGRAASDPSEGDRWGKACQADQLSKSYTSYPRRHPLLLHLSLSRRPLVRGMSQLDARLGTLLEDRKRKNRFRSLKEYDPTQSGLIDFVSVACTSHPCLHRGAEWAGETSTDLACSRQTTTCHSQHPVRSGTRSSRACPPRRKSLVRRDLVSSLAGPRLTGTSRTAWPFSSTPPRPCCSTPDGTPTSRSSRRYPSQRTGWSTMNSFTRVFTLACGHHVSAPNGGSGSRTTTLRLWQRCSGG
jgi:hypothetical protein